MARGRYRETSEGAAHGASLPRAAPGAGHLISKLYEHTSLVITTNLSFSEWAGPF